MVYAYAPPNQEQEAELFTSSSLQDITVSAVIEVDFDVINIETSGGGQALEYVPAKKPVPTDEGLEPAKKPLSKGI